MQSLRLTQFNCLIGNQWLESDKDLFFGPLHNSDIFLFFENDVTFPELLVAVGLFDSKNIARKNGWDAKRIATFSWNAKLMCDTISQPGLFIPDGWTDFRAAKGKTKRISILKIST